MPELIGKNNVRFLDKFPNDKLYHISDDSGIIEMYARIPSSAMDYEDTKHKRICFGKSVEDCMKARPDCILYSFGGQDLIYYVYSPKNLEDIYIFNDNLHELVPDAKFTNEIWVRNKKIEVELIGKIKVFNYIEKEKFYIFKNEENKYVYSKTPLKNAIFCGYLDMDIDYQMIPISA